MAVQLSQQIETLTQHVDAGVLSMGDERFARSLITGSLKSKGLSAKQCHWVGVLNERASTPQENNDVEVGDMSDLYAFFLTARDHLKFPKLTIRLPDDTAVKLYMSGGRSKNPDTINIVLPDNYDTRGRNIWVGRIHKDGRWELPYKQPGCTPLVRDLLNALQQDAHGIAAAYGKHTGNCCFCLRGLSDDRSLAVGYGKICAGHFGLSAQWKSA